MENFINKLKNKKIPLEGCMLLDNVYCKYYIYDISIPLVISFSNAGELTKSSFIDDECYAPWGFNFIKKNELNVLSFSCINSASWYRSPHFINALKKISVELHCFNSKFGYGGSMGGYAVGAFADLLGIHNVLLMNPISTLNQTLAPWETRFDNAKKLDWNNAFYDGAILNSRGYIVYDPFFKPDALHAKRYKNLIPLKVPHVGHGMPSHLLKLGMLQDLFKKFIEDRLDLADFYKRSKRRKFYPHYYKCVLNNKLLNLTDKRRRIVERHQKAIAVYKEPNLYVDNNTINLLRDAAIKIENIDINLSYRLMAKAYEFRPNGIFIRKKLNQYSRKLNQS